MFIMGCSMGGGLAISFGWNRLVAPPYARHRLINLHEGNPRGPLMPNAQRKTLTPYQGQQYPVWGNKRFNPDDCNLAG